ncbi:MAG: hypothetical protein KBC72_00690 [Acinetobacter sp.]|nr:hypothetical protein [Acinetobacter sp.]
MSLSIELKVFFLLKMLKYRYQLGGNIMCTLSNFHRLLDNCNILGSATDEHAYQQSVSFNLNEFITDSNDEIYHHSNYALKFDQDSYNALFKAQNGTIPEIKVIVALVGHLERDTVEDVIGYDLDEISGSINLKLSNEESVCLNTKAIDEYDGKIIQVYSIDDFLKNLDETVFIDNHWITFVLHDPHQNQALIPDDHFMKAYNVELTP